MPERRITGAIIAGGLSRRMAGRDKSLLRLGNSTVLGELIKRLSPQVDGIVINSNRDPQLYRDFNLPVIPDASAERSGPLSGVASVLTWLKRRGQSEGWLLTAPADTPFLPLDLAAKLYAGAQRENRQITYAQGERPHFLAALWRIDIGDQLQLFMESGGRAVKDFFATCDSASIDFSSEDSDPFFNINTPEDYQLALRNAKYE